MFWLSRISCGLLVVLGALLLARAFGFESWHAAYHAITGTSMLLIGCALLGISERLA